MKSVTRFETDAFYGTEGKPAARIQQLLLSGTASWNRWIDTKDGRALAEAAESLETASALAATEADAAGTQSSRLRHAMLLQRFAWTFAAAGDFDSAIATCGRALAAAAPLVEADPARYAPLSACILADRACAECSGSRFADALADLRESAELLEKHPGFAIGRFSSDFDPCLYAQRAVLQASIGAMARKTGDAALAVSATARAIAMLEPFLAQDANDDSGDGIAMSAPGEYGVRELSGILAACRRRLAD